MKNTNKQISRHFYLLFNGQSIRIPQVNAFQPSHYSIINSTVRLVALVFIWMMTTPVGHAQNNLIADGEVYLVPFPGEQVRDYIVPAEAAGSTIYFRLEGADGSQSDYDSQNSYYGGKGATIEAEFHIGNGTNEIPVGSTIRMIIGEKGNLNSNAGGGGTGLAFRHPSTGQWTILMVAGGGGGSTTGTTYNQGRPGTDNTAGTHGRGLSSGENNGTNGEDGKSSEDWARPGRGYLSSMSNGIPVGSNGPKGSSSSTWGFGGGGSRRMNTVNEAGGGGGGYSGGGGGRLRGSGAGGGGGSYVNGTYAVSQTKTVNEDPATNPNDGFVEYRIDCRLARNNEAEITDITFASCDNSFGTFRMTIETDILTNVCNGLTYIVYDGENTLYNDGPTTIGKIGVAYSVALAYGGEVIDQMGFTIPKFEWLDELSLVSNLNGELTVKAKELVDIEVPSPEFKFTYLNDNGTNIVGSSKTFTIGSHTEKIGLITPAGAITCVHEVNVNILDGVPPVFQGECTANVYVNLTQTLKLENFDNLIVTDNVTQNENIEIRWNVEETRYDCDDIEGVFQHTLYATDEQGNSSSCEATVYVYDTIQPTIICQDVSIDLSDEGTATINHLDFIVSATDNCMSEAEVISGYSWDTSILPQSVDCSHLGVHEIALLTSPVGYESNLPNCEAQLTIRDVTAPVITCRDTTIYIDQGNAPFTQETLPIESVFDACDSSEELSYTWKKTTSFTCADLGSDDNFWIEVKDPSNNSSQCIFTVTVLDTTAVDITCRNLNIELTANNDFTYTLRESEVFNGLTSLCNSLEDHPGTLAFSNDSNTFLDCDDIGSPQTVTLVYTPDDNSPSASCTSTISVRESLAPNITCPNGIIDLEATYEDCGAFYEYEYTAWDDECPEIEVSLTEGLPSGSIFPIGWNDVRIEVQDKSGNATACSFVVRVAAPTTAPTLECPEDYTVLIPGEDCSMVIDTSAIFHQTCTVQNTQYLGPTMGTEFEVGNYTFGFRTRNTETNLSSQCSFTVTVDKANKKPVAICKDTTVVLTNGQIELDPSEFDGGSYDSCYGLDYWVLFDGSFSTRIFNCSHLGENAFRLRVYNSIGAWSECETRVTFVLEDPQCQDINVTLDETGTAVITPEDILVADAACTNSFTLELNKTAFDCSDRGNNLVTLTRITATDSKQCTANVNVTVNENDVIPPVALCIPDTTIYVGYDWIPSLDPSTIDAGSYDIAGCEINDNISLLLNDDVLFCADLGPSEYVLTVTDASGNQSSCSTIVTIADVLGPEIIRCQDISIELEDEGTYTLTNSDIQEAFQTREVCLGAPHDVSQMQFDFDCTDLGQTIPMTIIGQDHHGNTSECDFTVTVNAAAAPTAVCQDVTVELSEGSYSNDLLASLVDGGSTSICGLELSVSQTSFDCSHVGDNEVTLTLTNEIGQTSSCQATLTVLDKEAPSAICQNITIQLDENGLANTTATAINNGSSDDCGLANLSLNQAAFSCQHIGDNSVTLTVTDISGNASDCQAIVTVQDQVAPMALCQDITVDLDENGQASISEADINKGSNDACGIATLALDKTDFDCTDVGTHTITLTATDENGNTASCQASVTIQDVTPPILFCLEGEVNLNADGMADITLSDIEFDQYDACGIASIVLDQTRFTCDQEGENTVTVTATDNNGNTSSCEGTITVTDNMDPVAKCKDITIQLAADGKATLTPQQIDDGTTDNCSIEHMGVLPKQFDCDNIGENVVRLYVEDRFRNESFCDATVTILDQVAPTSSCKDVTIQLDENGFASIAVSDINDGSTDACGLANLSLDKASFDCSDEGQNTVTLTATDIHGNTSSCEAIVDVQDQVAPFALCQNITIQLDENGQASISEADIDNGSLDACGIATLSLNQTNFSCDQVGNNLLILSVTDNHGNNSSCQANVKVQDKMAPAALCQNITVQLDENGQASISEADINNGSSDACGIAAIDLDQTSFNCEQVGDNTVTLTVTDNNENSSACQATVTVVDEVVPIALCQDITIQLDQSGQASIAEADINNGSSDACGIATIGLNQSSFNCEQVGSNTVTLTVTDNNENSSACQATVIVVDEVVPIALCQDITVQLDENGQVSISEADIDNGSNDACGLATTSLDQASFNCDEVGDNTVTLTVTDNNENSSTCQATVTVEDDIKPTLSCPENMVVNTDQGECGAYVTLPKAAPADNCGIKNLKSRYRALDEAGAPVGSWSAWADDQSGFFERGSYQIQWRTKDNTNNKKFCSFQLDVIDQEAPEVICQDVTINFNGEEAIAISSSSIFNAAASFDACGTVVAASQSVDEISCESVGEIVAIQVIGMDPNGNTSTCTAQVTVTGMPCGFQATDIDCEDGASATYDPGAESFSLTANNCEGYPDGQYSLVTTELCGDGEIIAMVSSLGGDGRAGVIMMESQSPDARFVSSIKDLIPRTRTEYRLATGGGISYKSKNRSGVKWVRIVREGPKFKTYTSTNGSYWRKANTIEFETFQDCIQVGLVAYNKNANQTITATFEQVEINGEENSALTQLPTRPVQSSMDASKQQQVKGLTDMQLGVAPNPFADQTQIEFTLPKATAVTLEIYNLHGQRVRSLENTQLDAGTHRYEWDGNNNEGGVLPTGIYMLRLRVDKKWITSKVSLINR